VTIQPEFNGEYERFEAGGLPPGLQVDRFTGTIGGVAENNAFSGDGGVVDYDVNFTARRITSDAYNILLNFDEQSMASRGTQENMQWVMEGWDNSIGAKYSTGRFGRHALDMSRPLSYKSTETIIPSFADNAIVCFATWFRFSGMREGAFTEQNLVSLRSNTVEPEFTLAAINLNVSEGSKIILFHLGGVPGYEWSEVDLPDTCSDGKWHHFGTVLRRLSDTHLGADVYYDGELLEGGITNDVRTPGFVQWLVDDEGEPTDSYVYTPSYHIVLDSHNTSNAHIDQLSLVYGRDVSTTWPEEVSLGRQDLSLKLTLDSDSTSQLVYEESYSLTAAPIVIKPQSNESPEGTRFNLSPPLPQGMSLTISNGYVTGAARGQGTYGPYRVYGYTSDDEEPLESTPFKLIVDTGGGVSGLPGYVPYVVAASVLLVVGVVVGVVLRKRAKGRG